MFFWFAGLSWVVVWSVFRSPALDYRLVMLGSVLPLVEVPFGAGPMHSIVFPVVALAVAMALTVGARLRRRRALSLVIGLFMHQVLDAVWADRKVFWWPLGGYTPFRHTVPELGRGLWLLVMELAGAAVLVWAVGRFGLDDDKRRRDFLSTGRLDRALAQEQLG